MKMVGERVARYSTCHAPLLEIAQSDLSCEIQQRAARRQAGTVRRSKFLKKKAQKPPYVAGRRNATSGQEPA
jgi:hypothetical protein